MQEYLMILIFVLSSGLWALGGTKGKFWRRYVLPVALGTIALIGGISFSKIIIFIPLLTLFASLGYGDGKSYWYRTLIGCLYSLSTLPLGLTIWQLVLPVVFISTFALSNYSKTKNEFPWKICELLTGGFLGLIVAVLIAKG